MQIHQGMLNEFQLSQNYINDYILQYQINQITFQPAIKFTITCFNVLHVCNFYFYIQELYIMKMATDFLAQMNHRIQAIYQRCVGILSKPNQMH